MMPVTTRQGPIVFAHRGGGEEAPENTMTAFTRARDCGVRHIETDAHVTADGTVVICHDETVDRCYDGSGTISDMTWRELSALRHRDSGEPMPLLAQVLETFPDMYFNIDVKEPGVEGPLLDVIAEHGAADRVLVASFSEPRLRAVRDIAASDPSRAVATSLGTEAVVRLVGAAKTATNPGCWHVPGPRQGAIAAQVPMQQGPIRVVDERLSPPPTPWAWLSTCGPSTPWPTSCASSRSAWTASLPTGLPLCATSWTSAACGPRPRLRCPALSRGPETEVVA